MELNIRNLLSALALPLLLAACSQDETAEPSADAQTLEFAGIAPAISGGNATIATRATTTEKEPLYIGRSNFVGGDKIVMTNFHRTLNTIADFTYKNVNWEKLTDESGWTRTDDTGKIYWSDAKSEHTLIGYSLPTTNFLWTPDATDANTFHSQLTLTDGAIDYTDRTDATTATTTKGSELMKADDPVLAYDTHVVADATGIATITFSHALAALTVDLNINGFSSTAGVGDNEKDNATRVTDLAILNQPYKYKWDQTSAAATLEDETATANVKAWTSSIDGDPNTTGRNRRFYYHALAVPGTRSTMDIQFTVTYPNPHNTSQTITNTYTAHATNVDFTAGKRTTIRVTLNHQDETMTVGAEYDDWEFKDTPDYGTLTKNSAYLTSTSQSTVNLHNTANMHVDDATWLYVSTTDNTTIVDVYGNDGTESNPYTIATANQLLAFAYEVNTGAMDFTGKYVRLNANLYLQPSTTAKSVEWIGIGTADHPFTGHFDGDLREINRLKGASLFGTLSSTATVTGVHLNNILGTTDGGSIARTNAGTITGCLAEGTISGTNAAGICAENTGTISVCAHRGTVTATTQAATIAAANSGTITACYSAATFTPAETALIQCHYDSTLHPTATDTSYGLTTAQMKLYNFVTTLNADVPSASKYKFKYQPSEYPTIE